MFSPQESPAYAPWWLMGIVSGGMALVALLAVGILGIVRRAELPPATVPPRIITAAATHLPTPTIQIAPALLTPEATPTPLSSPEKPIKVGGYVQVTGTEGILNLRAEPSLESNVNYVALEREVFQVQAGPAEGSNLVWWYLLDPATGSRSGWAAQDYLQPVVGP